MTEKRKKKGAGAQLDAQRRRAEGAEEAKEAEKAEKAEKAGQRGKRKLEVIDDAEFRDKMLHNLNKKKYCNELKHFMLKLNNSTFVKNCTCYK